LHIAKCDAWPANNGTKAATIIAIITTTITINEEEKDSVECQLKVTTTTAINCCC